MGLRIQVVLYIRVSYDFCFTKTKVVTMLIVITIIVVF